MIHTTKIQIETYISVSPEQAFQAYTDPQAIMQWNQASPDWHCPAVDSDLRIGGRYVARMAARDGSFGFDYSGTFEEVTPPVALTLRLDDNRQVRTTFTAEESGTRVCTVFDLEATNPEEMQRAGWQAILNNYAAYVMQNVKA